MLCAISLRNVAMRSPPPSRVATESARRRDSSASVPIAPVARSFGTDLA